MLGAIAGDVIGSRFEHAGIKSKDFELFNRQSVFTAFCTGTSFPDLWH
jgi:hypothetical protein